MKKLLSSLILACAFIMACGGKEDSSSSSSDAGADAAFCGDGIMQGEEECDDGNTEDNDVCIECRYVGDPAKRPVRRDE